MYVVNTLKRYQKCHEKLEMQIKLKSKLFSSSVRHIDKVCDRVVQKDRLDPFYFFWILTFNCLYSSVCCDTLVTVVLHIYIGNNIWRSLSVMPNANTENADRHMAAKLYNKSTVGVC